MERFIALLLFILVLPFILVLLILVTLTSPGSPIFVQKRSGKNFRPFFIYKIRTMQENAEKLKDGYSHLNQADGPVFKIYHDPRLTTFGKVLWKTGIDEILQLINIIKGDMSFVGPRPLPVDEAIKVPKKYNLRFTVKPGLTSLWIIRGAHKLTFKQWMESDLEYVNKKNFLLYMYIIVSTIFLILKWTVKEIVSFWGGGDATTPDSNNDSGQARVTG
ncbi:hypothetical protein A2767_00895 [Candidatus Roizmanbacteria bacterium RIFCSPHIGHO2_01_FULL_35_10]|uniref:Bacterial sugar transferase domain-containing protein n=1 Tax=Candidatus Roizmanbacteria bacterium RIFCSPLOWO2_01_FULL_35_13 TaxID=1802055 RepID=A0A1F7IDD9_9BACT|nr:MAG: hypothetical protein A2767_00895 [Candidatus Roizmanbacteria bacterium RIFCSPHIGHO2_01_FULL_35_10]OGK41360.1 MAG: hypothetical protein A3A74_03440 [Candidatus Roizmanbacteria bacterium RIFCSPLOWO2_01_FULL_35_13]